MNPVRPDSLALRALAGQRYSFLKRVRPKAQQGTRLCCGARYARLTRGTRRADHNMVKPHGGLVLLG